MLKENNFMKKIGVLAVTAAISVFALAGCGGDDSAQPYTETDSETADSKGWAVVDLFEALQDNENMPFVITDKAKAMLAANESLFLEGDAKDLEGNTDHSLEYRMLSKSIDNYGDKLMYIPEAYVISISETPIDDETTFTEMQLYDAEDHSYYVLSLMPFDDIFEDDVVSCYGLPLGETSFENISGGTTLAIVLAGSSVEKMPD